MIEVGKIVTRTANQTSYDSVAEESISVAMGEFNIQLTASSWETFGFVHLTSQQAIELGQILLKAAEVQPEYAEESKRLSEETTKLGVRYKDMISGLGLETEVDVIDARGTFTVSKALG